MSRFGDLIHGKTTEPVVETPVVEEAPVVDTEKMMRRWKKEKSFAIKTSGYHTYFGMASSALNNDGELVVKEDATKAEIKRAFAKSLKGKKMNKKILSEFIELVA